MYFLLEKVDSQCYVRVLEGRFVPYKEMNPYAPKLEIIRENIIDLKKNLEGCKGICWKNQEYTPEDYQEHHHGGLENQFPFQMGELQVPC